MKWLEKVALLLGVSGPVALFQQPALAAEPRASDRAAGPPPARKDLLMFKDPSERSRLLLFAAHRSHSSHSSHRSHSSHYSGSGGGYVAPRPLYVPPALPAAPAPPPPAARPQALSSTPAQATPRLSTGELESMVRRVQLALIIRNYDPGPVDGILSAKTQAALKAFQVERKLTASGYMDIATLKELDVLR